MFGILCSVLVNFSMRAPKEQAVPADFMPSELTKGRPERLNWSDAVEPLAREILSKIPGVQFIPGE